MIKIPFRRWLLNFNSHCLKKNFVLFYQSIYELTFLTAFLITFFQTEDYKWLVLFVLFDNFYNYILLFFSDRDQKRWFNLHAHNIRPNTHWVQKKKSFYLYLMLEISRTIIIAMCLHSVMVNDSIDRIWVGVVVMLIIDAVLLGDDEVLNVFFY